MSDIASAVIEFDPNSALERWCDQVLVEEMHRLEEARQAGMTFAAILGTERPEDRREHPYWRVMDELREELHHKLCDGLLIGSGYVSGDPPGSPRSDVEPHRWSVLKLDFDNWSAEGSGITLNDLRIREAGCGIAQRGRAAFETSSELVEQAERAVPPRLIICPKAGTAELDARQVLLPDQPFRLLVVLAQAARAGTPYVDHPTLEKRLWGSLQLPASRELRDIVRVLRNRLGAAAQDPKQARLLVHNKRSPASSWGLLLASSEIAIT